MNLPTCQIIQGDALDVLRGMEAESVDAIVTDPPYGLKFMGAHWDADVPKADLWREALRVLKPGGHLLAFFGTRTYHRGAVAVEDGGFEIRDMIAWVHAQGFPKSLDVSKAIDKAAGAEREVVSTGKPFKRMIPGADQNATGSWIKDNGREYVPSETRPATEGANSWEGWGTALKPALEPIVLARKPLVGTVAANVLEHGTGALNIDQCRIIGGTRWPANIAHDGSKDVVSLFPESLGQLRDVTGTERSRPGGASTYNEFPSRVPFQARRDEGSAARFFYAAKPTSSERNAGGANCHPTVKPAALMTWLVRLVTPPGGLVLDPFCGSGTTGIAAMREGFSFLGIEREADFAALSRARIEADSPLFNRVELIAPQGAAP